MTLIRHSSFRLKNINRDMEIVLIIQFTEYDSVDIHIKKFADIVITKQDTEWR